MKFDEFMESQIEPSFNEEFFLDKISHQLILEIEYKVMEAISYHEVNEESKYRIFRLACENHRKHLG